MLVTLFCIINIAIHLFIRSWICRILSFLKIFEESVSDKYFLGVYDTIWCYTVMAQLLTCLPFHKG